VTNFSGDTSFVGDVDTILLYSRDQLKFYSYFIITANLYIQVLNYSNINFILFKVIILIMLLLFYFCLWNIIYLELYIKEQFYKLINFIYNISILT